MARVPDQNNNLVFSLRTCANNCAALVEINRKLDKLTGNL
jgi:hypothetical protein